MPVDNAIESIIIPIMRFARTLHSDIDAVRNAIELPRNNGHAEGQVNRLKTLMRAMYGRAGQSPNAAARPHRLRRNLLSDDGQKQALCGHSREASPWPSSTSE